MSDPAVITREAKPTGPHAHEWVSFGSNVAECGSCEEEVIVPLDARCTYCDQIVLEQSSPVDPAQTPEPDRDPRQFNGSWSEDEDAAEGDAAFWHYLCASYPDLVTSRAKPQTEAGRFLDDDQDDEMTETIVAIEEQSRATERARIREEILPALLREFPLSDLPARRRIVKVINAHLPEEK